MFVCDCVCEKESEMADCPLHTDPWMPFSQLAKGAHSHCLSHARTLWHEEKMAAVYDANMPLDWRSDWQDINVVDVNLIHAS